MKIPEHIELTVKDLRDKAARFNSLADSLEKLFGDAEMTVDYTTAPATVEPVPSLFSGTSEPMLVPGVKPVALASQRVTTREAMMEVWNSMADGWACQSSDMKSAIAKRHPGISVQNVPTYLNDLVEQGRASVMESSAGKVFTKLAAKQAGHVLADTMKTQPIALPLLKHTEVAVPRDAAVDKAPDTGPLSPFAVAIGKRLVESFTAGDIVRATDGVVDTQRAYLWAAEWKRQGWLVTVAPQTYRRSDKFGK